MSWNPRVAEVRRVAREAVRESIPSDLWRENEAFVLELIERIETHPTARHPLTIAMQEGRFDLTALRAVALEFHHAFGQIFPNVLLRAMLLAGSVEQRLGVSAVCACRFLLQLNLLDELGFAFGGGADGQAVSDPRRAHAAKQQELMRALGISDRDRRVYRGSSAAVGVRRVWESASEDVTLLVPLLAVAEMLSERFFGPARKSFGAHGVSAVDYLEMHLEETGEASLDALHAQDLWFVVMQLTEAHRRDEVRMHTLEALDRIKDFLDTLDARSEKGERRDVR